MLKFINKIKYKLGFRKYTEWQYRPKFKIRFEHYSQTFETQELDK